MPFDPITAGLEFVGKIADKIWPDPAAKADVMLKIDALRQTGELAELAAGTQLAQAQTEINKIEAASTDKFSSRWRPFVGWVCGIAFLYAAILEPLLRFTAAVGFGYTGAFPAIDTDLTLQILLGILGLGSMRSFEKFKGLN